MGRRPSSGLWAARNALKRREERAREGGQASGSRERGRAEAAGGGEGAGAGEVGAARRGAGEPGTPSARTFPQSANFPGECQAHLLGAGESQREFEILGKKVGLPPSPFPCYEFPLKGKTRITANLL